MRYIFLACLAVAAVLRIGAASAEPITISCSKSTASAAIFIAEGKGYFAAQGLSVKFAYFDAALPVAMAVVTQDADIGITGLSAGFYNLAGKEAIRIIAGGGREVPGAFFTPYVASNQAYARGLTKPRDLAGHVFGLTTFGGPFQYDVIQLAEKYHFPLSSVKLVPLQSFGQIAAALQGGSIDAGLLTSVAAGPLVQRGDAKIIGWVGDETPWQLSAVLTSAATVRDRHAMLERFLRAYRQGTAAYDAAFQQRDAQGHIQRGPEAAALIKIIADYTGLSPQATENSLGYIDGDGRLLTADVRRQIDTWKKLGMVDAAVNPETVIDHSFIP